MKQLKGWSFLSKRNKNMKKILHILGIHDWKYETPTSEKIKVQEAFGNALVGQTYTGKWVETYAQFQKAICQTCGKVKVERLD